MDLNNTVLTNVVHWLARHGLAVSRDLRVEETAVRHPARLKVMAVSTDYEFLSVLRVAALDRGWDFVEAESISQAKRAVPADAEFVIIFDHDLCSHVDWHDVVSSTAQYWKSSLLIVASAYGDEYLRRAVLRLGGYDVIDKPTSRREAINAIEFARFWIEHSPNAGSARGALSSARGRRS